MDILKSGLIKTIDPREGGGMVESVIMVAVVAFVIYANIKSMDLSPQMQSLFMIVSAALGYRIRENAEKKDADQKGE